MYNRGACVPQPTCRSWFRRKLLPLRYGPITTTGAIGPLMLRSNSTPSSTTFSWERPGTCATSSTLATACKSRGFQQLHAAVAQPRSQMCTTFMLLRSPCNPESLFAATWMETTRPASAAAGHGHMAPAASHGRQVSALKPSQQQLTAAPRTHALPVQHARLRLREQ
jgi:hypothetical protein